MEQKTNAKLKSGINYFNIISISYIYIYTYSIYTSYIDVPVKFEFLNLKTVRLHAYVEH